MEDWNIDFSLFILTSDKIKPGSIGLRNHYLKADLLRDENVELIMSAHDNAVAQLDCATCANTAQTENTKSSLEKKINKWFNSVDSMF